MCEDKKYRLNVGVTLLVVCSFCEKEIQPDTVECFDAGFYGEMEAEFSKGYFSTLFVNGEKHTFTLCDTCLSKVLEKHNLSPERFIELFKNPRLALGDNEGDYNVE